MHTRPSDTIEAGAPGTIVAHQVLSFKDGDLAFHEPGYPGTVSPGGVVDVDMQVCNEADFISPLPDPDRCTGGNLFRGYTYDLRLTEPDGTENEQGNCLGMGEGFGSSCTTHSWSFEAPDEPGTYDFTIEMKIGGANEFKNGITRQIVVEEGAGIRPDDPSEDDDDGDDDIPWTQIMIAVGLLGGAAIAVPVLTTVLE